MTAGTRRRRWYRTGRGRRPRLEDGSHLEDASWLGTPSPLRSVIAYDPGPSMAELGARFGVTGLVKLNWNEDLFGLLPGVREAVIDELVRAPLYPEQAYADFREAVAAWTGRRGRTGSCPRTGSSRSCSRSSRRSSTRASGSSSRRPPTACTARRARRRAPRSSSCRRAGSGSTSRRWRSRPEEPSSCSSATRTTRPGTRSRQGEWAGFSTRCRTGCLVAVDEAYADYIAADERPDRIADVASARPVVVLRTFSKLFGIAGLRLGFAVVHPALVPCLDAVQEPFNLNRPALAAGMACLADPAVVEARRLEVVAAREAFAADLERAGFACAPSRANFVLVDTGVDDLALFEAMVRRGFLIRPGSEFGLAGRVRVTIGPSPLMERVVEAMVEVRDEIRDRAVR